MEKLKEYVEQKFSDIRNVLNMREKLLLRQVDVILQQLGRVAVDTASVRDVKFLVEQEEELLAKIRNFGRFHLEHVNLQDLTYLKNEDYISPQLDHETMYKNIKQQTEWANANITNNINTNDREQSEAICVDFSQNKSLIEHNAQHMNESIVNITLQEAKELIKRAKLKRDAMPIPPLNLEELDDELESSIAEAVSSLGHDPTTTSFTNPTSDDEAAAKSTKDNNKKMPTSRFKPKITINNCNGTINLRNISSLTINCAAEDSISARIPCQMQHQQRTNPHNMMDGSENEVVSSSSTVQHGVKADKQESAMVHENVGAQSSNENSPLLTPTPTPTATSSSSTTTATTTSRSASNNSSSFSSRSQSSKSQKSGNKIKSSQNCTSTSAAYPYGMVDYDDDCDGISQHAVSCDFYNRLLNEIRKSLRNKPTIENNTHYIGLEQQHPPHDSTPTPSQPIQAATTTTTTTSDLNSNMSTNASVNSSQQAGAGRRLVLKNFENLRIVLEANSSDEESSDPKFHPVQIEQWLAEIISETDLEPMQNSDILEHSKINSDKA